jgi:uncharacterized protein (TIGR03118 family)
MMKRRQFIAAGGSAAILSACGGGGSGSGGVGSVPASQNRFLQANLVATSAASSAQIVIPQMVDAWGIAIRPAGAGGHFWVNGGGSSWEFVGDVTASATASLQTLGTDQLTQVTLPGADSRTDATSVGKATGVAFNGAPLTSNNFPAAGQQMPDSTGALVTMQGSARFIFVTDSGSINAWTERRQDNGFVMRNNGATQLVYDGSSAGMSFFGCAVKTSTWDTLWVADFGSNPQIRQFDAQWNLVPTIGFANPFATGPGGTPKPGDFVPWNITALGSRVFVTFAKSTVSSTDITAFGASEEDSIDADSEKAGGFVPDRGRLVEYTEGGALVRIYADQKRLNSPWGVAIAPASFGAFGGAVLVGNFGGAGYITAFDGATGTFLGYLRRPDNSFVAISGLWGLIFGNGASLGDSDALYFAAGPDDEASGLFGSLRYAPL